MPLKRIGYQGHSPESFLTAVKLLRPDFVIDARLKPFSRDHRFDKRSLETLFHDAGIAYRWWRGLGNRAYKTKGIEIHTPDDLDRLAEFSRDKIVVLMCRCRSGRNCHTSYIISCVKSKAGREPDPRTQVQLGFGGSPPSSDASF
tara:strand:+ start:126 stop:560 length:435 start_codon:yes stop_codon:yes gene_type:complete